MMKKNIIATVIALLLSTVSNNAFGYDIAVKNDKGVTIYYNYINDEKELEVTWKDNPQLYSNRSDYSGTIVIPEEVTYKNRTRKVTTIGEWAFSYCSSLTSITIGNSVTTIGTSAFLGCSRLTSITIPNSVTTIGEGAFERCSGLTSVAIGNSVTSIGLGVFCECTDLTSVTIPNSVTTIGSNAFSGCSGLTSINIPNSVTTIGYQAFSSCSGLTSITIPNSVTNIGQYAFLDCSGLTSVTIPNSVTSISSGLFYGCRSLTSFTIPNSVTAISSDAFTGCSGLTSIIIPSSVTRIGTPVCSGCSSLTSIIVEEDNPVYDSRENCNAIITKTDNTLICGCKKTIIPNSVTSIGWRGFSDCSDLTSINIPASVTTIDTDAFHNCSSLNSVHITDLAAWCNIIFRNNTANPLIYAHHLYLNGTEIKDLVIPNSLTAINFSAFWGCSGLSSVTIPNSVTTIGQYAFYECSGLTSITIPNSVTTIRDYAFYGSGLNSVTIPNSVTSIGAYAFDGCDIEIVVSLMEDPFRIPGKNRMYSTFSPNTFNNATLYVPVGTIDKYKATAGWQDFQFIKEGIPSSILTPKSNPVLMQRSGNTLTISGPPAGTPLAIYDLSGRLINTTKAVEGVTRIDAVTTDKVVIVRVGERPVKVAMK